MSVSFLQPLLIRTIPSCRNRRKDGYNIFRSLSVVTLISPTGEVWGCSNGIVRQAKQRTDNRGIGGAASRQGKRYLFFRLYSVFSILFNGYRMVQSLGSKAACRLQCVLLIYALSTAAVLRTKPIHLPPPTHTHTRTQL